MSDQIKVFILEQTVRDTFFTLFEETLQIKNPDLKKKILEMLIRGNVVMMNLDLLDQEERDLIYDDPRWQELVQNLLEVFRDDQKLLRELNLPLQEQL